MNIVNMIAAPLASLPSAIIWYIVLDWARLKNHRTLYGICYFIAWVQLFIWGSVAAAVVSWSVAAKVVVFLICVLFWWFIVLRLAPFPGRQKPGPRR